MAAAVSSPRIHSLHGAFGAPSSSLFSGPALLPYAPSPVRASSWNRIPNVCAPRVRPPVETAPTPAPYVPASCSRVTGLGLRTSSSSSGAGTGRPRRTTMSAGSPAPQASRRAPPPPTERPAPGLRSSLAPAPALDIPKALPALEDPFADSHAAAPLTPLPAPPRPARITAPSASQQGQQAVLRHSQTLAVPPGLGGIRTGAGRDTRGRIVANALLNRGSTRPMGTYLRRRLSGEPQVYVKSGLSQLVAAAA